MRQFVPKANCFSSFNNSVKEYEKVMLNFVTAIRGELKGNVSDIKQDERFVTSFEVGFSEEEVKFLELNSEDAKAKVIARLMPKSVPCAPMYAESFSEPIKTRNADLSVEFLSEVRDN